MKVLIVDDEKDICNYLERELRKEGYEVEYTTSPLDVIERLSDAAKGGKPYELILLDLRMPKRDGFELIKDIRDERLDPDVIIITGYGDEDKAIEAIRLGAVDYLRKPLSLEELHTAIFRVQQKKAEEAKMAFEHRILVVDDEKDLCARLKSELEKEGYRVAVAYDGDEGLEYFKNNRVDLALVDIKMPKMSGLEMLKRCQIITDDFVSIIITGHGDHEAAIEALRLGVFSYLRKPLPLDELLASVNKGIDLLLLRRSLSARRRELEIETAIKDQYAKNLERMVEERTRELMETQDRLVQAEKLRALGLMASGVAHEFNNLLAAILGNIQLLKTDLSGHEGKEKRELSDQSMERLNTIERAASDGAETVRRIQEYTRIRKDRSHIPTDLNDIIENAVEFLRPRWKDEADRKKIGINVRTYLSDIPPILGNDSELRQVMTNLIINSIDAMPDGGDITIRTHRDGENVKVTVEDTGIGISKENIGKVFDPFFSTKDYKGTGLGLSVSYGIVKRHGGNIELEGAPGKGTTFILTFLAAHEIEEKEEEKAPPLPVKKAKILIIDDEESVRDVLSQMLSAMGHEVEIASSGMEGLALFHGAMESIPFDLVFTDLGMPEMNGWEVAGEIKKVSPTMPVALITGWGLEVDRDEMKRQGVDLIIAKPISMKELSGLVNEAMLLEI